MDRELDEAVLRSEASKRKLDAAMMMYEATLLSGTDGEVEVARQDCHDALETWIGSKAAQVGTLKRTIKRK